MTFIIIEFIVLACTVTAFLYFVFLNQRRPKNYPPGPLPLPILGNMHQLSREPYKDFMKMRGKYGDIISTDFGSVRVVILNDHKLIRKAFNNMSLSGRPRLEQIIQRCGGKPSGLLFNDGQHWVEQRRFVIKNLRDFGFGRKSFESRIHQEVEELIEGFKKDADVGKPISTENRFNSAVLNALWSIVTSERHSHDDPVLADLTHRFTSKFKKSRPVAVEVFFPLFTKLFPNLVGRDPKSVEEKRELTLNFMRKNIKAHQNNPCQENSFRDLIDVYLNKIKNTTNKDSSFYDLEGVRNLEYVMLDLFQAGGETASTTLSWTFLHLALHPEIQEKLHLEIKHVVGFSRLPSLNDRTLMPYTEVLIMEVLRYSAITPLGLQHRATEEIKLGGYIIPAETLIVANLYCVLHDPVIWGDADVFRPERFLSQDGKSVIHHDALIPFSTGKRVCPGETLARDELFLFITCLFQRFRVGKDPNSPELKIDYFPSAILIPKSQNYVLQDRFEEN